MGVLMWILFGNSVFLAEDAEKSKLVRDHSDWTSGKQVKWL